MKNIRVVNNIVQEIFVPHSGFELADCFTPDVVGMFENAPDNVEQGWIKHADGSFTAPVVPVIPVVTPE